MGRPVGRRPTAVSGYLRPVSPSRASRRSGDPRKRGAAPASPGSSSDRRWAVAAAIAVGAAVLVLALLAMRPDDAEPDGSSGAGSAANPQALAQAESACDLTTKAGEAAEAVQVDRRSRYAAAVLLLDRAIIDSARAAESDARLAELDAALQAVHTAGHEGDPAGWQAALDAALAECRTALG